MATYPIAQPGPADKRPRVLLVDDHDVVRHAIRLILEARGEVEVVGEAADGVEAVQRAHAEQPDLILLDLTMPIMSGLEALPHITRAAPRASVVVLSSLEASATAQQCLDAGAARYVEKSARLDVHKLIHEVLAAR